MKRLVSIMLTLFITLSFTTVFASGQKVTLTIEEAKKLAVEKSRQAVLDDLYIKVKEIILNDSKYDILPNSGSSLENAYKKGVEPIEVEMNLELAKRAKRDNLETLNYSVLKVATEILVINKELETEKQKLSILQDKYSMVQAKFKQKSVTQNDVNDAEYSVECKKNDIIRVEDNLEAAKLELQKLLNMPVNEVLVDIKDVIEYKFLQKADIENIITKAFETDKNIYEKEQGLKIKEKNLEEINHYLKPGSSAYDNAYYDVEIAKIELADAKANLETDIRNKYNDLLNQQGKVETAEKFALLLTKKLSAAETKYKKGTLNKESFLNEKEKYIDAVYQKYSSIRDYNVIKAEFENLVS
ncbi:MAG: TolC family protein [Clostridia bacterium]|nr:TolC family protein [Clostridia bacterium]